MSSRSRFERFAIPILLSAFVLLTTAYSTTIPLGEAPDEVSHWSYIQYLSTKHYLPSPEGAVLGESHQPPLYYLIGAVATFWIPSQDFQVIANPDFSLDDPQAPNVLLHMRREAFPYRGVPLAWHLVRMLSVAMGAITVWATWRLAAELFPQDLWIALGAAAFVAFLPEFVFVSAVVNNDNLVIMLASLSVLQVLRMTRRLLHIRDTALLGMLLGLAALAKPSGWVLWPFIGITLVFLTIKKGIWRRLAIHLVLCYTIAVAIFAPWAIYNLQKYGDPFGWTLVLSVMPIRQAPMTFSDWAGIASGLFTSFWGRFGGALHLEMAEPVYAILGTAWLIALLGWLGYARDAREHKLPASVRILGILFAVFWLLLLAAYVRWMLAVPGTDQARQLFSGLSLLSIVLVAGLARLSPKRKIGLALWSAGLFAIALGVLLYLDSTYAAPLQNPDTLPRLGGASVPVDFGETIRVIDYSVAETHVAPGQAIAVQIHWQALSDPQEDYWLLLQLGGNNDAVVNKDGVPSAGRVTTDWWKKGQVFTSRHTLVVPRDVAPGVYSLRLGLHPFGRWEWLPVRGQDSLTLSRIVVANP